MATLSPHINTQEPESQMVEEEEQGEEGEEARVRPEEAEGDYAEPTMLIPPSASAHQIEEAHPPTASQESRYSTHAELLINLKNSPAKVPDGPRIVDFSHFDMFMHSPSQTSEQMQAKTAKLPTSSARKRRIIDDDGF
jgi:hypothetical protein